jgi:hypothetical protein
MIAIPSSFFQWLTLCVSAPPVRAWDRQITASITSTNGEFLMNRALAMVEPTNDGVLEDLFKAVVRDGEKRLMLAVLESATEDFQKYVLANNKRGKELFRAAEEWILDTDDSSFFSFVNICDYLHLNPGYMRQGFMRWKAAKLNGHPQQCSKRAIHRAV